MTPSRAFELFAGSKPFILFVLGVSTSHQE